MEVHASLPSRMLSQLLTWRLCRGACAQIVWHDPRARFPGETMLEAVEVGTEYFARRPDILFVCLPDTGGGLLTPCPCMSYGGDG